MHGERRLTPHDRLWIGGLVATMFALVGFGAWVRLVDAGLSMVRWEPIMGILPPIGREAWERVYGAYMQTPQYAVLRPDLEAFRLLFWPEYLHRVLGRFLCLALALPLLRKGVRARLGVPRTRRLAHVVAGNVFQGTVGWVMVASGLRDRPMVHPWMLAFHLTLATLLLLLLTAELDDHRPPRAFTPNRVHGLLACALAVLVLGALVAGLRAGILYPTFPGFRGVWLPEEVFACGGAACFVDGATLHWLHRMGAYGLAIATPLVLAPSLRAAGSHRTWALRVIAHLGLQVALGAAVVLTRVAVPLAVLHQLNAVALVLTLARLARLDDAVVARSR